MNISSGNRDFDKIIDGGYGNFITTFYGPAASGKTTFCLLASIEQAGNNKKIIFLDTENGFSVDRLKQVINKDVDKILDNMIVVNIKNFKNQQEQIKNLLNIVEVGRISLVVIDSIGVHYRRLVRSKSDLANKMLISQLRILNIVSKKCPVIITNQVYTDIDEKKLKMVGGLIVEKSSKYLIKLENSTKRSLSIMKPFRKEIYFNITNSGISISN